MLSMDLPSSDSFRTPLEQGAIDAIYKDLTISASHPTGGTARLSMENPDDPFDGAVRFGSAIFAGAFKCPMNSCDSCLCRS